MSQFVLYNYFRSSPSYRVRIALHHKNIPFTYQAVHLLNNGGEQHSEAYKKINPQEEVPTLVHDGKVLSQSLPIVEYLEELFPQPALFPKTPYERARVRQFCENINSFMHPLGNLKVTQYLEKKHAYTTAQKEEWIQHWMGMGFAALEKFLEQTAGTYCFGDQVTAADIFLVPQIASAKRFNVKMDAYPLINRIEANCLKVESFQKAHPFKQVDTPPELRA